MLVHLVLEGHLEEPVAGKLLKYCGHDKGVVYGRKGYGFIATKAHAYEPLTRGGCGVLVLTDFRDAKSHCPPEALHKYLLQHNASPSAAFIFRFAEAELESWLMADRKALAAFLSISLKTIPEAPDREPFPKRTLVNLARKSRKTALKSALVPPPNHGGSVGPGYLQTMTDFVIDHWRPGEAMKNSPSLARCLKRLQNLSGDTK